jgi:hypothetical protein
MWWNNMRNNELLHKLNEYSNEEVYVKVEGGLYYPIKTVKTFDGRIIILCENVQTTATNAYFEPAKFIKSGD